MTPANNTANTNDIQDLRTLTADALAAAMVAHIKIRSRACPSEATTYHILNPARVRRLIAG